MRPGRLSRVKCMLISDFHLTYTDSVAAAAGIRAASEGRARSLLEGKDRGGNDSRSFLKCAL